MTVLYKNYGLRKFFHIELFKKMLLDIRIGMLKIINQLPYNYQYTTTFACCGKRLFSYKNTRNFATTYCPSRPGEAALLLGRHILEILILIDTIKKRYNV